MAAAQEEVYNTHLAALLAGEGMAVSPEARQPDRNRIDVLAIVGDVRVAVEAKIGNRKAALNAANTRITQGHADAAIAVSYPTMADPSKLRTLDAAASGDQWRTVNITELARLITETAGGAGDIDSTLNQFRAGLEAAADRLNDEQAMGAVRIANIPLPSKEDIRKKPAAVKHPRLRLALLVASAALFHANLDGLTLRRPRKDARTDQPYLGGWPPQPLRQCLTQPDVVDRLIEAWNTILALDYKPVFEAAVNVLQSLPPGPATAGFTKTAAGAGLRAAGSLAGRRHDLLGRVFHWILSTATPTGAFYTSEAAATLLAGLALRPQDAAKFPDLTIVDPACGTGTLLMAAAKQLAYLNQDAASVSGGRDLIERVLHGYDIEAAAVQLAAVALGLMNPKVKFEQMGIHHLNYGTDSGGTGVAGSLELYGKSATANLLTPTSAQIDTGREQVITAERHDLVIMNPPFTRDSLRHDHLGAAAEKAVKGREAVIFADAPASLRNSGGLFMMLAERLCAEDGTVATVLPTVACGNTNGRPIWDFLLTKFHLEKVVTSHDPRRTWFSENTGISETLFVLRRLNDDNRNLPTRFYNLTHNPGTVTDALRVVADINTGGHPAIEWPTERLRAGDWTPVKFLSPFLVETTADWFSPGGLGCVPLGDVADVGPAGQGTRGLFKRAPLSDTQGMAGLWYNNQENPKGGAPAKQTMAVAADSALITKTGKDHSAEGYWKQRGRLMLACKPRLTAAKTCSVLVNEPVLGSGWVPVKHRTLKDPADWEKSMCAYLNSTIGVAALIRVANPQIFGRPALPLDDGMRIIPVPDLTAAQNTRLARVFEELANRPLRRFRDADNDPVRAVLDRTVCEVLGWDLEQVETARRALSREPSVTGQPATT